MDNNECIRLFIPKGLACFSLSPSLRMANSGLGVPVKLLHESLGHIITVELKTGQLYRGKLAEGAPNLKDAHRPLTFSLLQPRTTSTFH